MPEILDPDRGTTSPRPSPRFSCGGCAQTWTGVRRCHCSACHVTFSSPSAFDAHVKTAGHVDPATVGLVARDGIWGAAGERPDIAYGGAS